MASSQYVSEEDLHAFVDGETDVQTNAVILAYLAAQPADAARVETWRTQNELIRASFAKIEHEPVPLSLSLTPTRNLRTDTLVQFAPASASLRASEDTPQPTLKTGDLAKLCAAIGIAFAGGMIAALITPHFTNPAANFSPNRSSPPAATMAADLPIQSQTLEIAALREKGGFVLSDVKGGNSKDGNETGSKLFPGDFNAPPVSLQDLAALDLSVTGFQVGSSPADPALCLFLLSKAGEPLTLCLKKPGSFVNAGYHAAEAPPLRSVDWPEKTGHFALAGRLSEAALLELSQRIHTRIEASAKTP